MKSIADTIKNLKRNGVVEFWTIRHGNEITVEHFKVGLNNDSLYDWLLRQFDIKILYVIDKSIRIDEKDFDRLQKRWQRKLQRLSK